MGLIFLPSTLPRVVVGILDLFEIFGFRFVKSERDGLISTSSMLLLFCVARRDDLLQTSSEPNS